MKTKNIVLTLFLVMTVGVGFGTAQVVTEEPAVGTIKQVQQESQFGPAKKVLVVAIQDLELTDEQEARIAAIRKEYRPKFQKAAKELNVLSEAEVNQIRNALTPEQRETIKEMLAERAQFKVESLAHTIAGLKELDLTEAELAKIREISTEYRPRMEEAAKQLDDLLTDAQKKAREEAIEAGKPRREILRSLNLTSEQTANLESVGKELKELVSEEADKIRGVLTAGQKEQLQELTAERREMVRDRLAHKIANLSELNLTEQQKAALRNIRQEFRPKIQEAGNNLRTAIGEEVRKTVAVLRPAGALAERPERAE